MNSAEQRNEGDEARGAEAQGGSAATGRPADAGGRAASVAGVLEKAAQAPARASETLKWVVYALVDPRDSLPHYIGCTRNLRARYLQHVANKKQSNKAKCAWVAELHSLGLQPKLRVLAAFAEVRHAQECEQLRVDRGFADGWPLVNRRGSARSPHGQHTMEPLPADASHGKRPLSMRQVEVLRGIDALASQHGFAPTIRELGDALGIGSTNGVNEHLCALERGGVITRAAHAARSIVITAWGREILGRPA